MANILVYSQDTIGTSMAGPGIRYWEFAKALSRKHKVTLAAPNTPDVKSSEFTIVSYKDKAIGNFLEGYDAIIAQSISPTMAYVARRNKTRIILDYYDPILLENLEVFRNQDIEEQRTKNLRYLAELQLSLTVADSVICASQKQRDLWVGSLMALNRITPDEYLSDVSLNSLIDVVPFGVQNDEPVKTGEGFRKRLGIKQSDTVILWGGGIWNWFDPLTLIKAVAKLAKERDDIKLVFMGLKHPNDDVPEMEMAAKAVALAKDLGVYDKSVFFNFGWVAYNERQNYFLEADIGATTHFNHLETRFSFRTRVLDYFWAQLPLLATEGDSMADLAAKRDLGVVVPYEDVDALVAGIVKLADDKAFIKKVHANLAVVRDEYRWNSVVEPILQMIDRPRTGRKLSKQDLKHILAIYRYNLKDIYTVKGVWPVISNVGAKAYKVTVKRGRS